MNKISRLQIRNFLGIDQLDLTPGKINLLSGGNERGKTSVLEAIEKALSNNSRRPTVVRRHESEATLYVELSDGTEIDRRIRNDKSDYIKVTKDGKAITGPESYLKTLFNSESFDPTDFLLRTDKEQADILLELIEIDTSKEKVLGWFGEAPENINYNQHGLRVLKSLESHYYAIRKELNSEIKQLQHEVDSLKKQLPDNFVASEWREVSLKEKFDAITKANEVNNYILQANILIDGLEDKKKAIEGSYISALNVIKIEFEKERGSTKEEIQDYTSYIKGIKDLIEKQDGILLSKKQEIDIKLEREIQELKDKAVRDKAELESDTLSEKEKLTKTIHDHELHINSRESHIKSTYELEKEKVRTLDKQKEEAISEAEERVSNASIYLKENQEIDVHPLSEDANTAELMKGYIPLYDRMETIIIEELNTRVEKKYKLEKNIEMARELPAKLLREADHPIEGLGLDDRLQITVYELPVANLSTSQKIKFSIQVARSKAGDLKLINVDKFESLDEDQRALFLDQIKDDDYQYFIACVTGGDLTIETGEGK